MGTGGRGADDEAPGHCGTNENAGAAERRGADEEGDAPSVDAAEGPGPPGSEVFDVGLQHERTALAWDRTGLGLIVVGAISIRVAGGSIGELLHLPGYLVMGLGAALLWFGARRYRHREGDLRSGVSPVRTRLVVLTGIASVGIGVASLLLVLVA
jgi:uncharacterized membrane protein YidH (DUF202 family)